MITVKGIFKQYVYKNHRNGFCWFYVYTEERTVYKNASGLILCEGSIPDYGKGFPLEITGEYDINKKKLIVSSYKELNFSSTILKDFLLSIYGVKKQDIQKIVLSNVDLFDLVKKENAIDELISMGISEISAENIVSTVKSNIEKRELMEFVYKHGGTYKDITKLYKISPNPLRDLNDNPYNIGERIGLELSTMDTIAKDSKNDFLFSIRMEYVIEKAIDMITQSGNAYDTISNFYKFVKKILSKGLYTEIPDEETLMNYLSINRKVKVEGNLVFVRSLINAEKRIAKNIKRLYDTRKEYDINTEDVVKKMEEKTGRKYASQQAETFNALKSSGIKVVIGGPGTGKTTTINGLLKGFEMENPNAKIMLLAPTGKAAQRMTESTERMARTIHKGIEIMPIQGMVNVGRTAENPLECDVLVVDEMSMTGIYTFDYLLEAVKDGTMVILVGDTNQLESVEAGQVLGDIIDSECVEVYQLTEIFRQKGDSPIVTNAYAINDGKTELIQNEYFKIYQKSSDTEMLDVIKDIFTKNYDVGKPFDCQILSPTHKGMAGVESINKTIQEIVNPKNNRKELAYGNIRYREKDKIIMLANDYTKGYCNGDTGTIIEVKHDSVIVNIQNELIEITEDILGDMDLAYAYTIHKSQGSEHSIVIVSLPDEPACMLVRNLLYTAVTRAKQKVVIVAGKNSLYTSIKTTNKGKRNTKLKDYICEAFAS